MTKKRFHYDRALDKLKDRNTGDDYYDCDIAELVNYLYEENKELKDLLKSMADRNNEIWLNNGQIIRLKKVFKGEWTND